MARRTINDPLRSLEEALADVLEQCRETPADSADKPRLREMVARLRAEIAERRSARRFTPRS